MPFEIVRNDITKVKADAIVNTANPYPVVGAGTDTAVHSAAGPQLLEARKEIGYIVPGGSVETPAFALPARYVIHTVTTAWVDGEHGETEILRAAYRSALELADGLGCRSVAFPLLSAGSYGFPPEIALSTAIQEFTDFLLEHDMKVILSVFSKEAYSLAGSLFDDVRAYIDDNYAEERSEEERRENYLWKRRRREELRREASEQPTDSSFASFNMIASAMPMAENKEDLKALLRNRESTFVEYLRDLIREKEVSDPEVYRRANMSRQKFNKIINNPEHHPKKDTAIQLAIGLQLDLSETQKLLEKAGYALTRSSKSDIVIEYYIRNSDYNILEIDVALVDAGLPPLS